MSRTISAEIHEHGGNISGISTFDAIVQDNIDTEDIEKQILLNPDKLRELYLTKRALYNTIVNI